MVSLAEVKALLYRKVWGEHSLTVGELACFAIGAFLLWKRPIAHSRIIGLAVIILGMALF